MTCNAIRKPSHKNSKHRKKTKLPNWYLDSNEDQKKYGAETPSQGGDKKLFVGMGLHIVFFHYPKTTGNTNK